MSVSSVFQSTGDKSSETSDSPPSDTPDPGLQEEPMSARTLSYRSRQSAVYEMGHQAHLSLPCIHRPLDEGYTLEVRI